MSLTSGLFKAARLSATARALSSGDPKKIARRGKNIVLGRAAARGGLWRRLWGGGRR
jgi:hypothetical protein